uniref:Ig-like domain-containing protein n=1 Tax=Podarcis muralis TaxID=64176 RepID=A0A670K054_PODMU
MGVLAAMFWVPVVLFLETLLSGSESQVIVVTQPASMSVSPGSTVKLPCAVSSDLKISSERVRWYQQKTGTPSFLYHYYTSSDQGRGSGVPERFSVSPDSSKNLWNLVITGVQAEDEANYYCSTWDNRPHAYHCDPSLWGTETKTSYCLAGHQQE